MTTESILRKRFFNLLNKVKEQDSMNENRIVNLFRTRYPKTYKSFQSKLDLKKSSIPHHFSPGYKGIKETQRLKKEFKYQRKCLVYGKPECHLCKENTNYETYKRGRNSNLLKPWPLGCSHRCVKNNPIVFQKREATCRKIYGVKNVFQSKEIITKIKKTHLKNYGVTNPMKTKQHQERARQYWANLSKEDRKQIRESKIKTNLSVRGVAFPMQSESVKEKRVATYFENYGVSNPSQSNVVQAKIRSSWKRTKEVCVQGKTFSGLQGYEPQALLWIVNQLKIPAKSINANPKGLPYQDASGKAHYYFPDFEVTLDGETYCVEVKSTYTLGLNYDKVINNAGSYANLLFKYKAVTKTPSHYILLVMREEGAPLLVLTKVPSQKRLQNLVKKALAKLVQ